jgi:hypothetical protein
VRRGAHAADDGSFGRSAGNAALRGALLIIAAVVLGLVLLRATDADEPFASRSEVPNDQRTPAADDDDDDDEEPVDDPTATTLPAPRPPAEVGVTVANGARVQGAANRRASELTELGYRIAQATNTTARVEESRVYFTEGYEAEARALAEALEPSPPVEPMPPELPVADLGDANVLLVIGTDLSG